MRRDWILAEAYAKIDKFGVFIEFADQGIQKDSDMKAFLTGYGKIG